MAAMSASVQEEKIGGIIEQVKLDTSRRYEAKISNIESHLHELKTHNQALTSELSKWTVDDSMFEDPDGDDEREEEGFESPRRGREGDKSGGRNRYDYEGLQSVSEPSDADRSLLQLEEELDDDGAGSSGGGNGGGGDNSGGNDGGGGSSGGENQENQEQSDDGNVRYQIYEIYLYI